MTILTCEHAGNEVPSAYARIFKGHEEVLVSHRAIDLGGLRLAKHLSATLELPLFYTTTTRLLVEANRSLHNDQLFSEFSKSLPSEEKEAILTQHYYKYRHRVEETIQAAVTSGKPVFHVSVHTFTPALDGEVRTADIGILFDPDRPWEKLLAHRLIAVFDTLCPGRNVVFNEPYPGTADGFTTYLRKKFQDKEYAGFELEINQKFFLNGEPEVWEKVMADITAAMKKLVSNLPQLQ